MLLSATVVTSPAEETGAQRLIRWLRKLKAVFCYLYVSKVVILTYHCMGIRVEGGSAGSLEEKELGLVLNPHHCEGVTDGKETSGSP